MIVGALSAWLRRAGPLLLSAAVLWTAVPAAAFDDIGFGARAPGMADAQVAVADDGSAAAYNPAGLIQLGQGEITTEFGEHARGLTDGSRLTNTYLGWGQPLRRGYSSIGVIYQNFQADEILSERTLILGFGRRLSIEPFGWRGIWSFGVNLKQLRREFSENAYTGNAIGESGLATGRPDPVFQGGAAKDAITGDFGLLYQFGRGYNTTAGLVFTNITRPDVSLAGDGDRAPMATKFGLAHRPDWGTLTAELRRTRRLSSRPDTDIALGAERSLRLTGLSALTFRAGYAEGSREYKAVTAGVSYHFGRFRFDYAFKFPMEKLAETDGAHRAGFSMRLGRAPAQERPDTGPLNVDLLHSFRHDSLASYAALDRVAVSRGLSGPERELLLQLLMRRYAIDDDGMAEARREYRQMIVRGVPPMDWARLKFNLTTGAALPEKEAVANALELLVKGEGETALLQLSSLTAGREDRLVSAVRLMSLSEEAAKSYRANDLPGAVNRVREMLELLPADPMIMEGYRELLSLLGHPERPIDDAELPEAPSVLTAPVMGGSGAPQLDAMEERARAFGTSLGYYLTRKAAGAPVETLLELLKQMRAVHGQTGMDMSIVEREISAITNALNNKAPIPPADPSAIPKSSFVKPGSGVPTTPSVPGPAVRPSAKPVLPPIVAPRKGAAPAPAPKPPVTPVTKPVVQPAAQPTAKPAAKPATGPNREAQLERAWSYYRKAMERDVTDAERLEVLESMRKRFGNDASIVKEMEKIRRRLR